MAGNKYKAIAADGLDTEIAAVQASAGAGDAGKIVALNASGFVDPSMMNGVGPDQLAAVLASEAISAGDLVNIYNNAGTLNVRKADASAATRGKVANGYAPAGITNGGTGLVYMSGIQGGYTSLTPGAPQFLSATPGARTETPTTTSGQTLQCVGYATSATAIRFNISPAMSTIRG